MGHACHRTQIHLAQPGGLFAQWGPHQRQRFTSLHSQEHHTEDGGSTSPSSSFTIPLNRACQVQFQMICVVSGVLPILKSPFFSVCCKRILVLHYSHLCALPWIPQKHNKDVFTAWDSLPWILYDAAQFGCLPLQNTSSCVKHQAVWRFKPSMWEHQLMFFSFCLNECRMQVDCFQSNWKKVFHASGELSWE